MSIAPCLSNVEPWCLQTCPFCGHQQPVVVNGIVLVNKKAHQTHDRGYSFCNCKNIWFTDWANIDQSSYLNPQYTEDHKQDGYRDHLKKLFKHYQTSFFIHGNSGPRLLDLGYVVDYLLDEAKLFGYETTGLDIGPHSGSNHRLIQADFDKDTIEEKFDIIIANHFFEHIHYPLEGLKKCYSMLNPGGLLFISMPDPFQIDWRDPNIWAHWFIRQHYIMWDLESFCDEAHAIGFKTKLSVRNFDVRPLRDYHLLFKKPYDIYSV